MRRATHNLNFLIPARACYSAFSPISAEGNKTGLFEGVRLNAI